MTTKITYILHSVLLKQYIQTLILLSILLSFLLIGCKDTTSDNYDETRISDIMYNIERAFNDHDIDVLMRNFDNAYLHNGQSKWEIREVWLTRMALYTLIDFQNITIDIHNQEAVVSFRMKLTNSTNTVYMDEPATNGDLSYFIFDNSDWIVCGNQNQ